MSETFEWEDYEFRVLGPLEFAKIDEPGVYVFAAQIEEDDWIPIYVGQTNNFCQRFADHKHDKWVDAMRHEATHIHARNVSDEIERTRIEHVIIDKWDPPLNRG